MLDLSLRLKTIASLVPFGARVCDVGTDHGYLSIHLKQSGIAKQVIASDLRPAPLESAKKNIENSCVTGIDLRLGNGLQTVTENEVDTVIIAGMGGEVISAILNECDWIKSEKYTLILQPTTSAEALRKFLYETGFETLEELPLAENEKLYAIMKCRFANTPYEMEDYFYYIGKISPETKDGKLYLQKQQKRVFDCMKALENIALKQNEYNYYKTIYNKITKRLAR